MIIYVDMDGVLANFNGKVKELLKTPNIADVERELAKPNWGKISEYQNLYSILEPMPDAIELWEYLMSTQNNVQILTALPRRAYFPDAVNDKRNWIHHYFGNNIKVNFGPYAADKMYHCFDNDILIDDMKININQWKSKNGIGILHTSAKSTIEKLARIL